MPSLLSGLQWNADQLQRLALPVTIALVIAVGYGAARLTWGLVPAPDESPAPTAAAPAGTDARPDDGGGPEAIPDWHLLGEAAPLDGDAADRIDAPETRLNLQLRGVFYSRDTERAQAIISGAGSGSQHFRAGDSIGRGGTIEAIYEDRVILRRQGSYETLSLPGDRIPLDRTLADLDLSGGDGESPAADESDQQQARIGPDEASELEQYRQRLSEDPQSLQQMVSMQPEHQDGQMVGVRVSPGQDDRIMELIGLEPGDVVTSIDGTELSDPNQAFQALQNISGDGPIEMRVLRDGSEQSMQIDFN